MLFTVYEPLSCSLQTSSHLRDDPARRWNMKDKWRKKKSRLTNYCYGKKYQTGSINQSWIKSGGGQTAVCCTVECLSMESKCLHKKESDDKKMPPCVCVFQQHQYLDVILKPCAVFFWAHRDTRNVGHMPRMMLQAHQYMYKYIYTSICIYI